MPSQDYLGRKSFVFECENQSLTFSEMVQDLKENLKSIFPHLEKVIDYAEGLEQQTMPDYGQAQCLWCGNTFNKQTAKDCYCGFECAYNGKTEKVRLRQRKYLLDEENKRKNKIRKQTRYKIKTGKLKLGNCAKCNSDQNVEAHHISYKKGFECCIVPLCKKCHQLLHKQEK